MLAVCPAALGYDMMGAMLTIATVNVNGLRAAWRKGMPAWIDAAQPDIILMQEVRAPDDIVHGFFSNGWSLVQQACDIKGRAGVAIATRHDIIAARIGLGPQQPEIPVDTGRWVEADIALEHGRTLTVVSAYIHSGTAGTPKMDEKYSYLNRVTTRLAELNTPTPLPWSPETSTLPTRTTTSKTGAETRKAQGFSQRNVLTLTNGSTPAGTTPTATSWANKKDPTPGGQTEARHSTTTQGGALTTTSPHQNFSPTPHTHAWTAHPPTTHAGPTTPHLLLTTP